MLIQYVTDYTLYKKPLCVQNEKKKKFVFISKDENWNRAYPKSTIGVVMLGTTRSTVRVAPFGTVISNAMKSSA